MYRDYYRLREEPFNITPDPRFLFLTPQHQEAINHLLYGIRQRKGFICLTGEVGTGKTTLCRTLLDQLGPGCHTGLILNPILSETQLLRAAVEEFGLGPAPRDRLGCLTMLNQYLLGVNAAGENAVLIIDEAQDMPDATLEMTRLLSNLETTCSKLLQIVLVGQPELRHTLAKPTMRQLAQRITVRFHLGHMTGEQTRQYIHHRLIIAAGEASGNGGPGSPQRFGPELTAEGPVRFEDEAINEIHRQSGGTPRLINAICDKSLLAGFVYKTNVIDTRLVHLAVGELKEAS